MSQRWRSLLALTLARAAMGFQFQSVAAASPFIDQSLGIDKAQLGGLIGLYFLPGIVFALPGGLLGARFGDKRLVLVGLALMSAGGLWLAFAGSPVEASVARIVGGAGAVMLNVLVTKMVADWFEGKERLLAMSILINAWPIGIGIALLVVGPLSQRAGWPWGIVSSALFAAIGGIAMLAVYRDPPAPAPATAAGVGLAAVSRREWQLLGIASLPWLLYNAAFQVVISFLPTFFAERGLAIASAGSLVALNVVMFVVGVQAGGLLLKRAGRPDFICVTAIVAWCATLLLIAARLEPLPWIVLGGLLGGLPAAAFVSLPSEFLRPASRGAGMGVFYTVYYLGCAILPSVAGKLYDLYGGHAALWAAAAMAFASVPALRVFRRMLAAPASAG